MHFIKLHRGEFALVLSVVIITLLIAGTIRYQHQALALWNMLGAEPEGRESLSTTVRNMGLVLAGIIALFFALWRIAVLKKQADAAEHQSDVARQSLLNERYQKAAEMLGSPILAVRLAGIYALQQLTHENPRRFHVQILRLFCAFVRHPPEDSQPKNEIDAEGSKLRDDVQEALRAIGSRNWWLIGFEKEAKFVPDLSHSDLRCGLLGGLNLSGTRLNGANLSGANLQAADLSEAELMGADLSYAKLERADLHETDLRNAALQEAILMGADLYDADLSGSRLPGAMLQGAFLRKAVLNGADLSCSNLRGARLWEARLKGTNVSNADMAVFCLTQERLMEAYTDPNKEPELSGAIDPDTKLELVWRRPFLS